MATRPVVPIGLASCCTILSIMGVLLLTVFGYGFAHNWEMFMGSTHAPKDGGAVASVLYTAALVYGAFVLLCGCQLAAHRRYSRIRL